MPADLQDDFRLEPLRSRSHHPQYIDTVHREHAVVETGGVRTAKAHGAA
jgi:hypothetical protein